MLLYGVFISLAITIQMLSYKLIKHCNIRQHIYSLSPESHQKKKYPSLGGWHSLSSLLVCLSLTYIPIQKQFGLYLYF